MIAAALRSLLLADAELVTLLVDRVIYGGVDSEVEPEDTIRYRRVDGVHESSLSGEPVDLQFPLWEFSVRSSNPFTLDSIAARIVAVCEANSTGATATVNATPITIDTLTVIDSGTDEPSVTVSREGVTDEVFIRSVLVEVGHR